jgi:hypothetical protein
LTLALAAAFWLIGRYFPTVREELIFLGIACLLVSGRNNILREKVLVLTVVALGLSPILGWVPHASTFVDPILVVAAISIGDTAVISFRKLANFNWYLAPIILSSFIGIERWRQFRSGSADQILSRLLSGWDHFGHFYLYLRSLRFDSFVARIPELVTTSPAFNRQYPAGIQMNWAQWWPKDIELAINHPELLLDDYMTYVLISAFISMVLMTISIVRVFKDRQVQLIVSFTVSIAMCAFIFVGPLSIAIWKGFPNFLIAIAGASVVASLIYTPLESTYLHLITLLAAVNLCTYNWYPLLIPLGLAVIAHLIPIVKSLPLKRKVPYLCAAFSLGLAASLPVIRTLSFGLGHIKIDGGIDPLSPNLVVAVLAISSAVGLYDLVKGSRLPVDPRISPFVMAPLFGIVTTLYVRLTEGGYPYYVQKISIGIVFLFLILVPIRFEREITQLLKHSIADKRFNWMMIWSIASLIGIGSSQLFGYVGPDWQRLAPSSSAIGVKAPKAVEAAVHTRLRTTKILISVSENVLKSQSSRRDCFVLDDIDMQDYDPVLTNYWVGVLTWTLTDSQISRAQKLISLKTGVSDVGVNALAIESLLDPRTACPIVSKRLAESLVTNDAKWADVLWIIDKDGKVSKFRN